MLVRHGFQQTDVRRSRVFGEGYEPIPQARLEAVTAHSVIRSIERARTDRGQRSR